MNAARRLAAILAADVVGHSRLMGEDEAERERREAAEPNTANLRERIVKAPSLAPLQVFRSRRSTSRRMAARLEASCPLSFSVPEASRPACAARSNTA